MTESGFTVVLKFLTFECLFEWQQ